MVTHNTDYSFTGVKYAEAELTLTGDNRLERKNPQPDLKEELLLMQRNMKKVKTPVKKIDCTRHATDLLS